MHLTVIPELGSWLICRPAANIGKQLAHASFRVIGVRGPAPLWGHNLYLKTMTLAPNVAVVCGVTLLNALATECMCLY